MTDQKNSDISLAVRATLINDDDTPRIDLARSMDAVETLARAAAARLGEGIDVVVTRPDIDDGVLAYAVARELGCERAIIWEDLGLLSTSGVDLAGRKVALLTVSEDHLAELSVVAKGVEHDGATVVTIASALSDEEIERARA